MSREQEMCVGAEAQLSVGGDIWDGVIVIINIITETWFIYHITHPYKVYR